MVGWTCLWLARSNILSQIYPATIGYGEGNEGGGEGVTLGEEIVNDPQLLSWMRRLALEEA